MEDKDGYAVYFFPPALEALGEAIKPFLLQGPTGEHVLCRRIDTAGSLIGMHLYGRNAAGVVVQVELMVPTSMVRMIVSARSDEAFGFGPRHAVEVAEASSSAGPIAKPDQAPKQDLPSTAKASKATPGKAKSAKSKPARAKPGKPAQPKRTGVAKKSKPTPRSRSGA